MPRCHRRLAGHPCLSHRSRFVTSQPRATTNPLLCGRSDPNILDLASTRLVETVGGCKLRQRVRLPHYTHGIGCPPSRGAALPGFTATYMAILA